MLWSVYSSAFRFAWDYWKHWPWALAAVFATRIGSTLIDVTVPIAAGKLVEAAAKTPPAGMQPALVALAWFLLLAALVPLVRYVHLRLWNRLASHALRQIVYDGFAAVQRFSADWHANAFAGATVRKITRGMWAFDSFGDTLMFGLIPALVVAFGVTLLFTLRWPVLGLVVGVGIIIFICVSVWLSVGWVAPAARNAQESDSRIGGYLADTIGANAVVKAFGAEVREQETFADIADTWRRRSLLSWNRSVDTGLIQSAILWLLQGALLGCGVWLWFNGRASAGDMAYLVATQFMINGYLRDVGQHVRNLQKSVNEMEDVVAFRATQSQVRDHPAATNLKVPRGGIEFDNVTICYAGQAEPLYTDFASPFAQANASAWWAIPAAARAPLSNSFSDSTTSMADASSSMAKTLPKSLRKVCAKPSAWCPKKPCCFTAPSPKIFPTAVPTRITNKSKNPPSLPTRANSLTACRCATTPWSASAASSSPVASVNGLPSPARSWPARRF